MRLGIWIVAGILEKSKRFLLAVFCCAMYKAPNRYRPFARGAPQAPGLSQARSRWPCKLNCGCATGKAPPSHTERLRKKKDLVLPSCKNTPALAETDSPVSAA